MFITGDQTNEERSNLCGCGDSQYGITVDGSCFVVKSPNCGDKKLCLGDLFINSSNAFTCTKTLKLGEKFVLSDEVCDYNFLGIYVANNESLLYRELDSCSDNMEVVNYDFDIQLVTADVTADCKIPTEVTITLTPDNTSYVATWDNVDTIYINGQPFINWVDANLSWFDIGSQNISNRFLFPQITHTETVNLHGDDNGNWSNTFTITASGGESPCVISYQIEIRVDYDYGTSTLTYEILSVKLVGDFLTDDVVIQLDSATHTETNNIYTINLVGKFKTISAIRYKSLKSVLILSGDSKLGDFEFYNPSGKDVVLCIMGVS